jgi:transcriptional regulator with XRE-family HTH domain
MYLKRKARRGTPGPFDADLIHPHRSPFIAPDATGAMGDSPEDSSELIARLISKIVRRIDEDQSALYARYMEGVIEQPGNVSALTVDYLVEFYDIHARWCLFLVKRHADVERFYLKLLKDTITKVMNRAKEISVKWPAKVNPQRFLSVSQAHLTARSHHWKAQALKRAREAEGGVQTNQQANPPPDPTEPVQIQPETKPRRGYRNEVQAWMRRKEIGNVEQAARRLGLSKSALKSIMSERGKPRYSEDTLARILKEIGHQIRGE